MGEATTRAEESVPADDPLVGALINERFRVERKIASGGMGAIYYATQAPLDRPVALKVLSVSAEHGDEREGFHRRFDQEASILAKLQHPNIVSIFDYGRVTIGGIEHYFMAMEYLEGETLHQRFRRVGALGPLATLRIARQIARGLREAHKRGFVHRDLKPSNVILVPEDDGEIVKLVDFGIGKAVFRSPESEDLTGAGLLLGTPRYMAPEQIRGEVIEPRTDLYGLGVIMFQSLTGRVPFQGKTSVDLMLAHCTEAVPDIANVCPEAGFSEALRELVASVLQKSADERPTMEEFQQMLTICEEELGVFAAATQSQRVLPPVNSGYPATRSTPASSTIVSRRISRSRPVPDIPVYESTEEDATRLANAPSALASDKTKQIAVAAVCGLLLLLLVGVVVGLRVWGTERNTPVVASGETPSSEPAPAQPSASAAPTTSAVVEATPPAVTSFRVYLDSSPSGAVVVEGAKTLGSTPLVIEVDRDTVAEGPRHFRLRKDGYQVTTFDQSDASSDVRAVVTLAPVVSLPVAVTARGPIARPPAASAVPSTKPHDGPLDIRLRR
ncbi:MAG TPA: serine/threonine-protein kinase [Labilithrix sp.]|nr:serine/threonine-protein kinase [Labilithrix sp.]